MKEPAVEFPENLYIRIMKMRDRMIQKSRKSINTVIMVFCIFHDVSDIKNSGIEVILVSSGAIGMGVGKLNLKERPKDIAGKQACAAVGQCELMYIYDKEFSAYNHTVAQILLTAPDLKSEDRHEKFKDTMSKLLELSALPIINENDTVATEEIVFGDNDTLAALVAESVSADLLILLSDIDGLYTADPTRTPTQSFFPRFTSLPRI